MYDVKIYQDGRERETIRGLSLPQASALQSFLDRNGIKHIVKRLTKRALDGGDSAASEQFPTPEVLSTLQGESTPAPAGNANR